MCCLPFWPNVLIGQECGDAALSEIKVLPEMCHGRGRGPFQITGLDLTSYKAPFDLLSSTLRSDWRVSQKHDVFVRWSRDDNSSLGNFGGNRLPSSGNINSNTTNQLAGGLDTVLTSTLTNSLSNGCHRSFASSNQRHELRRKMPPPSGAGSC